MADRNPLEVLGKNASLYIEGASIIQKRNSKKTIIPISNVQSVTIYPSGFLRGPNGSIVISTAEFLGGIFGVELVTKDELPYAQNIQKYISDFQANANTPINEPAPCKLDQLKTLKTLLDSGTIDQQEFEKLKKELID